MSRADEMRDTIHQWWVSELANDQDGAARSLSARLRRASGIVEILSEAAVHELGQKLGNHFSLENLAYAVVTLAQVKQNSPQSLPSRFGEETGVQGAGKDKKKTRLLSDSRFQRVVRAQDPRELAERLRRALPIVGSTCNVGKLGADFLFWNDKTRIRWLSDYFRKPAPSSTQNEMQSESDEATA